MALDLYLAFVLASVVLIVIPGPNAALIVANSVAHGGRFGLLTLAGTSSAVVVHLTLTALGAWRPACARFWWRVWGCATASPAGCCWALASAWRWRAGRERKASPSPARLPPSGTPLAVHLRLRM